jgi:hypothetical protein
MTTDAPLSISALAKSQQGHPHRALAALPELDERVEWFRATIPYGARRHAEDREWEERRAVLGSALPDVFVPPTAQDWLANRDAAMEAVLTQVRKRP